MALEIRHIVFADSELKMAFESYGRITPNFLPAGKLISATPVDDSCIKLAVEIAHGSTRHQVEFSYQGADVIRPLVMFCIENNIVLPRDGKKTFAIKDGNAVLLIELNLEMDALSAVEPMLGEHVRLLKFPDKAIMRQHAAQ